MPQQLMNNENARVWFLFPVCHIIRAVDYVLLTYPQRRGVAVVVPHLGWKCTFLQEVSDFGYPESPLWRSAQPLDITETFALGLGLVLDGACHFRQLWSWVRATVILHRSKNDHPQKHSRYVSKRATMPIQPWCPV